MLRLTAAPATVEATTLRGKTSRGRGINQARGAEGAFTDVTFKRDLSVALQSSRGGTVFDIREAERISRSV
jgi:hypothetical protein